MTRFGITPFIDFWDSERSTGTIEISKINRSNNFVILGQENGKNIMLAILENDDNILNSLHSFIKIVRTENTHSIKPSSIRKALLFLEKNC